MRFQIDDIIGAAISVWFAGRSQSTEFMNALAWLIKHRAETALRYSEFEHRPHPVFGDGSLTQAGKSLLRDLQGVPPQTLNRLFQEPPDGLSRAYLRALATVCSAVGEESADPTNGALFCHHHMDNPAWAAAAEPSALIGPLFFYGEVLPPSNRRHNPRA